MDLLLVGKARKFKLQIGGGTMNATYLGIIERVTVAFLDGYLKGQPAGLHRMLTDGRIAGLATLLADL